MSRSTATPNSSTRRAAALSSRRAPGVVSVGGQGPSEQHPRLSGFVRGVDLAPGADALPQRGDGLLGVAAVERQLPACDCGRGRRSRGAEPSGQLLQLGDALGRRLLVTHRQARRDVHREQEDAALSSEEARVGERAAEAPHRRPAHRPCASSKRPRPGWPSSPSAMACGECLLGAGQVAATHPDLDQLAVAPAGAVAVDREQLLARLQDPLLRLGQLTVEPVDLPLVEAAEPACSRRSTRARSSGSTPWSTRSPVPSRRAPGRSRSPRSTRSRHGSGRPRAAWPAPPPRRQREHLAPARPAVAATWASPCTAIASMPGLPTRRAIARASWSDARAPRRRPPPSA